MCGLCGCVVYAGVWFMRVCGLCGCVSVCVCVFVCVCVCVLITEKLINILLFIPLAHLLEIYLSTQI